jgi:hypothetical protein
MERRPLIQKIFRYTGLPLTSINEKWMHIFVASLEKESREVPTYLDDIRTPLPFRKYAYANKTLSDEAAKIRFQEAIRLWTYYLRFLSPEEKSQIFSRNPLEIPFLYPWPKDLLLEQKKNEKARTLPLELIIKDATSQGKGMFACPECHSKEHVESETAQLNRSDEGMQCINVCKKCQKTWRQRH